MHPQQSASQAIQELANEHPSRLKSPFQFDSASNSFATTSNTSSPSKPHATRGWSPARRQRRTERSARHTDSHHHHPFDDLPWIMMLDSPPSEFPELDIADLSQLPIPDSDGDSPSPVSVGPVRRRKRSFRSDPLCFSLQQPSALPGISHIDHTNPTTPTTSPSKPRRARAFHRLMPVFSCDTHPYIPHSVDGSDAAIPSCFMP